MSESKLEGNLGNVILISKAEYDALLARCEAAEAEVARLRQEFGEIIALLTSRHGDDDRFEEPESDMYDAPETITVKRLFDILDKYDLPESKEE